MKNKEIKPIMQEIEYGTIECKLDDYLNKRNITTYELSTKSNIRFQTIKNLRENISTRIDFEVLAKICYSLECNVDDILKYKTNKDSKN